MRKTLRYLLLGLGLCAMAGWALLAWPRHTDMAPARAETSAPLALDPSSPWPKFRADALQNGRTSAKPVVNPAARPWVFQTGKGVFSSPVIDKDGVVYIGSADQRFYAIDRTGREKWRIQTGEIIDSSALLDDRGRVFFGSGDGRVYAARRDTGQVLWTFQAQTPAQVKAEFGIKTHNVNWFEGNIGLTPGGALLAPNDNNVVYALDRDSGARRGQYLGNEMVWSLPAINAATGRLFFGTTNLALRTVFAYDIASGRRVWTTGGLGSVAATSLLTSDKANGGVVVGGFDGFLRAYRQAGGQPVWKAGLRDHIYASPAQLSNGLLIQPCADGTIYAIDPKDGHTVWTFDTLEPIRSSPAVDGNDVIYIGSGEGRLLAINPDGTLRWAYRLIDGDRNDLNSSPALGRDGIVIGGEDGGVYFTPYDYCLGQAGRADSRCAWGPKSDLPADGAFLLPSTVFGKSTLASGQTIAANQPLTFTLLVRRGSATQLAALDKANLRIEVGDEMAGQPAFKAEIAANGRFLTLTPRTTWTPAAGGSLKLTIRDSYRTSLSRFGLKFFGGRAAGEIVSRQAFNVAPRAAGRSTMFEASRLSVPNPTMLPSWNQIGFDSLHYLMGTVTGDGRHALVWVIGGRLKDGRTVVDPRLQVRYPLLLTWDGGLVTLNNDDGFKVNFVGSWDMPFAGYRISARADPDGRLQGPAALSATALCDQIAFYGPGLKLMGLSDVKTGRMTVVGGLNLAVRGQLDRAQAAGFATARFSGDAHGAVVSLGGSTLRADAHVYSLLLTDARDHPLPLYYTRNTHVAASAAGIVTAVRLDFGAAEKVHGPITARFMIDTYPAARGALKFD